MEEDRKEILTMEEAAEFLRLDRRTVRRLVELGGLPGRRLGRQYRFVRADLERCLTQGTTAQKE